MPLSSGFNIPAEMLRDVETALTGPLPCIHEIDPVSGEHTTSEAAPEEKGVETNYVRAGTLTRLSEEQDAKMQEHVFAPVDRCNPSCTMLSACGQLRLSGFSL